VFFPFYPFLIKLFALIFRDYMLSALVVSNLAYVFAALYLYRLVLLDYPKEVAIRAVFYFSIFPTAYFLHAGYTESLFITLTIASFFYARKEKWLLSSLLGMLACSTRITGLTLLPALLVEYLFQREFKIKNIKKDVLWLAIIPIGFVAYLIINYMTYDDPLKFLEIQKGHWRKTLALPLEGFLTALKSFMVLHGYPARGILQGGAELIFGVFGFLLTIFVIIRFRISYGVYMLLTWLIITSTSLRASIPRYTLSLFPLFIPLSLFGQREEVNYFVTFVSLLFFVLFLCLFIEGQWAF
jgi:hypothetical protein